MKTPAILIVLLSLTLAWAMPAAQAQNFVIDNASANGELSLDEDIDENADTPDPLRGYNRWMFKVNDKIYRYIFNPVIKVYDTVVHKKVQESIHNVGQLVRTPIRFANNLLQQKYKNSVIEVERLVLNATLGVAGLFDIASKKFDLPPPPAEDLPQTLGSWGIGSGPYIVLPILGPSDPRDIVGTIGDMAFDPVSWAMMDDAVEDDGFIAYRVVQNVNNYAYTVRGTYERVTQGAIDEYIAVREFYIQNRDKKTEE